MLPSSRGNVPATHLSTDRPQNQANTSQILTPKIRWQDWPEVRVQVSQLHSDISTTALYELYKDEGNISRIQIDDASKTAVITFDPPPRRDFWEKDRFTTRPSRTGTAKYVHGKALSCNPRLLLPDQPTAGQSRVGEVAEQKSSHNINFSADVMKFGVFIEEQSMAVLRKCTTVDTKKYAHRVIFSLDLTRKEIQIRFSIKQDICRAGTAGSIKDVSNFKMHIRLSDIPRIHRETANNVESLTIPLGKPARFFRQRKDSKSTHESRDRFWDEERSWIRQTEIMKGFREMKDEYLTLMQDDQYIDLGRWTVYRIEFDRTCNPQPLDPCQAIVRALADHQIEVVTGVEIQQLPKPWPSIQKLLDGVDEHCDGKSSNVMLLANVDSEIPPLHFKVRYQLEVCLSHGILNEMTITESFVMTLAKMAPDHATSILERGANGKKRIFRPHDLFDKPEFNQRTLSRKIPFYCSSTRSATVTPTAIYYHTPVVETSNRVVRHYHQFVDRFLRVRFSEEKDEGRVNPSGDASNEPVFSRIERVLRNGIVLGDRHYEFVAFGNSQFREHGAWFFARTPEMDASAIRDWMGDFSSIKNIGKYISRLGQCFSTTWAMNFTSFEVKTSEDVIRNGFCFTDGIGKISLPLAQRIADILNLKGAWHDPPSAFQFRLRGCKGMLAVDPNIGPNTIVIRRSQEKFPAGHQALEIIRVSRYAAASLNRQLIAILSTLGIPDQYFHGKVDQMLTQLESAMTNEAIAASMLQKNVDINESSLKLAAMILDGFMRAKDPFTISLLQLWKAWSLKYLKEKAKILIEEGAFVLGVTDETGTLKGHYEASRCGPESTREEALQSLPEIFLRVSDEKKRGFYKVITGVCILARNPSLHPGDIRVVHAVDVKSLHHLKNVVVFPQNGDRDLPNMCSGGDLDGDDYVVIWDEYLIPPKTNFPPMSYTSPKPEENPAGVTVADMRKFFVEYIKNDRLGSIANNHLAMYDQSSEGVKDARCLELAQLHSKAVDFPKTCIPAIMTHDLRTKRWPHFMGKDHLPQHLRYHSKKILGQLYDRIGSFDYAPKLELSFDERILNAFDPDENLTQVATEIKAEYDAEIRQVMIKHGIATEFEVWTAFVLRHNESSKDYTFSEELGKLMANLTGHFRKMIHKKLDGDKPDALLRFAHAMYVVTQRQVSTAAEPLISFPWLLQTELGKIANDAGFRQETAPLEQGKMDTALEGFEHLGIAGAEGRSKGKVIEGDLMEFETESPFVPSLEEWDNMAARARALKD